MSTPYVREFASHWRALLSASLGLSAGTIALYVNNLFSPALIAEFGWEKADFALIGLTVVGAAIFLPIAGRAADRLGTRRMAIAGIVGMPLVLVGLAGMNGDFWLFFLLSLLQMLIITCLVGIVVYGRLIAGKFDAARGLALGIASCAPPLATALLGPFLSGFIADYGWRAGYLAMAAFTAAAGLAALILMRGDPGADPRPRGVTTGVAVPSADYAALLRSRTFQLLFGAMVLCNVHYTVQTTQLKVILLGRGISAETGSLMVSLFAAGVVVGRILCGLALDRFPSYLVAAAIFGLPSAGLALLGMNAQGPLLIGIAILSLGLSMGAEGDLVVYLAARYFPAAIFSSVLGLLTAAMAVSASLGALVLSAILARTGSYLPFLCLTAATMLAGSLSFLLLPRAAAGDRRREGNGARATSTVDGPGLSEAGA